MTNLPPSVLCHCWLGHQTCKNRRPYNLYCVGADVKPCSINAQSGYRFRSYVRFFYNYSNTWCFISSHLMWCRMDWIPFLVRHHKRPLNQTLLSFDSVCAYVGSFPVWLCRFLCLVLSISVKWLVEKAEWSAEIISLGWPVLWCVQRQTSLNSDGNLWYSEFACLLNW